MGEDAAAIDAPAEVRLGSVLVSLLDPLPGREVEFNRWYERDHFYSGCMVGPHFFAGRRFVATARLKDARFPLGEGEERSEPKLFADDRDGSYLALYWLLAGHHDDAERWSVDRVQSLIAHDRMMSGRRPIHAGFYDLRFSVTREADGVPPELALDHPFQGVGMTMVEAREESARPSLARLLEERVLPRLMTGSPVALVLGLSPRPLPEDAPAYVERPEGLARRILLLSFFDVDPAESMRATTRALAAELEREGAGRVLLGAPFIPTIPGTDRYTDELW